MRRWRALVLCWAVGMVSAQELADVVTGRVVDEAGGPLAGVVVCAWREGAPFLTPELTQGSSVTTDVEGRWRWTRPAPSEVLSWRLLFVGKGRVHVAVPWSAAEFPVVLPRGRTLAGRVVDAAGKPLAGVRVEQRDALARMMYRADASKVAWPAEPRTAVATDASGRFVMPGTVEAGLQLVVGAGDERVHGPFAHGDAVEIVHAASTGAPVRDALTRRGFGSRPAGKATTVVAGTVLGTLPIRGAGLCLWSTAAREVETARQTTYGQREDYGTVVPIAADGTFRIGVTKPGTHRVKLLLPRPLQQGQPDLCDMGTIDIVPDGKPVVLDARPHLPAAVVGRVRSPVPNGRLLVGVAVARDKAPHNLGFVSYASPLATVAADGSFATCTPPGDVTIFVIDLLTGVVLHRAAPRPIAAAAKVEVELDVAAGAVDVALDLSTSRARWLELVVPQACWPHGLDDIVCTTHEYSKRIGCFLADDATVCRLWLPPTDAEAWLCEASTSALKAEAKAAFPVEAGKIAAVSLSPP